MATVNIRVNISDETNAELERISAASGLDRGFIVDVAISQFAELDATKIEAAAETKLEAEKQARLSAIREVVSKKGR